jgi:hypothetical protein
MHAAPTAHVAAEPVTSTPSGRHRLIRTRRSRLHRLGHLTGRVGSVVSLAALALLGTTLAVGPSTADPAERPTLTVTYDVAR